VKASSAVPPLTSPAQGRVLNLGAGLKRIEGAVNVDLVSSTNPDVVHDLDVRPWPFRAGQFAEVHMYDVLEHLDDVTATMEEVHRVCESGATLRVTVPHYSCANAFTDPTHKHYFSVFSLDYYTGENEFSFYSAKRFRTRHRSLLFAPTLFNKVVRRVANRFPREYERRWAWMFPAWFLYFELEVMPDRPAASGPNPR
jgi:SAM-dependent methyltransferase